MTSYERKCMWAGQIAAAMMAHKAGVNTTSETEMKAMARGAWRFAEALDNARPPKPVHQIKKEAA